MKRPRLITSICVLLALLVIVQFAGPARTNPPTDRSLRLEAQGPVPAHVVGILKRACFDCHSNETRWPWYARVAPAAWLVIHDVNEARGALNFSHWGEYNRFDRADMLDKACDLVKKGKMPLSQYLLLHRGAKLAPADVTAFCEWTDAEATRLEGAETTPTRGPE